MGRGDAEPDADLDGVLVGAHVEELPAYWVVCCSTRALIAGACHSWLAFSRPSVMIATITVPGRWSSGSAASLVPASVMIRPIASCRAVMSRGWRSSGGTSSSGRSV